MELRVKFKQKYSSICGFIVDVNEWERLVYNILFFYKLIEEQQNNTQKNFTYFFFVILN